MSNVNSLAGAFIQKLCNRKSMKNRENTNLYILVCDMFYEFAGKYGNWIAFNFKIRLNNTLTFINKNKDNLCFFSLAYI